MPLTDDFMLPQPVRTMEQMADLLQAEEAEINQAQRTIDAMAAQLAVGASTFLLPRHERIFGLPVNTGESLEVRRARVLARLNTRGVTTVQAIRELVEIVTGREGEVIEHFGDYAFSVAAHLLLSDSTILLRELIRQIDEIKPAHLVFDTIVRIEPVVLKNRQRFFFAALTVALRQWTKPGGLGLVRLVLPMRAESQYGAALAFFVQARARQPTAVKLTELLVGRYKTNNLEIEQTLLDGKGSLNGSWRLSAVFHKGVRLSRFVWHGRALNRQTTSASLLYRGQVQNPQKCTVNAFYRTRGRNVQRVKQGGFLVTARARNVQRLSGSVTMRRTLPLDGAFLLNGNKKLNAGITRSEL